MGKAGFDPSVHKIRTSSPLGTLQLSCLQRFGILGNPPGRVSAFDLHKFSLSVWRMSCPGRTMGTGDVEQSHHQASNENGVLPGSVGWIYGRKTLFFEDF